MILTIIYSPFANRITTDGVHALPPEVVTLFSESQGLDHFPVPVDVLVLQVFQQPSSLTHKFEQAPSGMMIFSVDFEMLVQVIDALCEQSNLNLRRSRIRVVEFKLINQCLFLFRC
jgi:hypothetical protein